jgi:hypothetical protein
MNESGSEQPTRVVSKVRPHICVEPLPPCVKSTYIDLRNKAMLFSAQQEVHTRVYDSITVSSGDSLSHVMN